MGSRYVIDPQARKIDLCQEWPTSVVTHYKTKWFKLPNGYEYASFHMGLFQEVLSWRNTPQLAERCGMILAPPKTTEQDLQRMYK